MQEERWIVFDVETPNSANDRMSAIGICCVAHGQIVQEYSCLVNPEARFDSFNIALTGITPALAANAPSFPQLWQTIGPLMGSGTLIAHNAPFDMSVLAKCLRDYQIPWRPFVPYACTCRMARKVQPQLENHRLNTLCEYWHIPLTHHDAASDARACAKLLLEFQKRGIHMEDFLRIYDMNLIRTLPSKPACRKRSAPR